MASLSVTERAVAVRLAGTLAVTMYDKLPPWFKDTRTGIVLGSLVVGFLGAAWYFDRQTSVYKDRISHLEKENERLSGELREAKTGADKQAEAASARTTDAMKTSLDTARERLQQREDEYKALYASYSALLAKQVTANTDTSAEHQRTNAALVAQEQQLRYSIDADHESLSRLLSRAAQYKTPCAQYREGKNWHMVSERDCQFFESAAAETEAMKGRIALKERDLQSVQSRLANGQRQ